MNARLRPTHGPRAARRLAAGLAGLLVAAAAVAQVPTRSPTEMLETGTDLVSLPGAPNGTLLASECRGCAVLRLSFARDTRYFIGDQSVPYARLLEAAGKGNLRLYVSYRRDNRALTRLRLVAAGASQ
jgi:hypothetical protein